MVAYPVAMISEFQTILFLAGNFMSRLAFSKMTSIPVTVANIDKRETRFFFPNPIAILSLEESSRKKPK
jgi:hypothetical protein